MKNTFQTSVMKFNYVHLNSTNLIKINKILQKLLFHDSQTNFKTSNKLYFFLVTR
jgi:hypothetical protein